MVSDSAKLDHIVKILTVFQKTCNDKEDIQTVKNLGLDLGLDLDLNNLDKLDDMFILKYLNQKTTEELNKIYETLIPISEKIEAQINPKDKDSIYQCLNDDQTKKNFCLGNTTLRELKTIDKNNNCPVVVGGKKSKRSKQRKTNRKSKKQRNKKRR